MNIQSRSAKKGSQAPDGAGESVRCVARKVIPVGGSYMSRQGWSNVSRPSERNGPESVTNLIQTSSYQNQAPSDDLSTWWLTLIRRRTTPDTR